jgi:hypothetical protein
MVSEVHYEFYHLDRVHELGNDGHLRLGVNSLARSEEVGCSESVGVEITTILVAVAVVARLAGTAGGVTSAGTVSGARMGSESSRDRVLRRVGQ